MTAHASHTAPPRESSLSALVTALFRAWQGAGIEFVVLRNHEGLPRHVGNDLDVLVDPARASDAETMACSAAREAGFRLVHRAEFSPISLFFSASRGEVLHLDLFRSLTWRGFPILDPARVLAARRRGALFDVPSLVHEASLNLMTRLLYRGQVREKYRSSVSFAYAFYGEAALSTLRRMLGSRSALFVLRAVERGDWTAVERSRWRLRVALAWRGLITSGPGVVSELWNDFGRYWRRLRHPPGLMIAFLGPDGSGKSSVARAVQARLSSIFYPDLGLYIHWRPSVLRRRPVPSASVTDPHARPSRSRLLSALYLAYHSFDYGLGRLRVGRVLFRNGLVVCDRYYHDFYVDPRRYRLDVSTGMLRLGHRLAREPDLVFCLAPSPASIQSRKQELPAQEVAAQRSAYMALARRLPHGRVVTSDGDLPEVLGWVQETVLEFLHTRVGQMSEGPCARGMEPSRGGWLP